MVGFGDRMATVTIELERRVAELGKVLARRVGRIVEAAPGKPKGPGQFAKAVGIDKVLAGRALKAAGSRDPVAVVRHMPGPEPLRRLAHSAGKKGVSAKLVRELEEAAAEFEELIRKEAGDRSGFDALLASWVPEARREFEVRRKQAAFRAMSQLVGKCVDVQLATVLMAPSRSGEKIDVVWISGLLGLQRLRPGVPVKLASRRIDAPKGELGPRHPVTLDGREVEGMEGLCLPEHCTSPLPTLRAERVGDVVHYSLGEAGFGPNAKLDVVYAEVNADELPRYVELVPKRKRYVFAEVSLPAGRLVFDALVHRELIRDGQPSLHVYDTVLEGVANVNDRTRDVSRLDLLETLQPLGAGVGNLRTSEMPWYSELLGSACSKLGWNAGEFRAFRAEVEYPIYGSQVTMAFDTESR